MPTVRRVSIALTTATVVVLGTAAVAQAQTTNTDATPGVNWGVILIFGVLFGVACALIANAKGRSPVLWGILGFLFGLIPLIIIAVLKKKQPEYSTGYGSPAPPPPPPI